MGDNMGDVIELPIKTRLHADQPNFENDPYYRFIRNVLLTADACGFELPFTIESAAEHVYLKTREQSELARMLRETVT